MRDPQKTKEHIIAVSAALFNVQGYKATSLSDITKASGFTKGAIYKHFKNKEDLEQQSLRHLNRQLLDSLKQQIKSVEDPREKIEVIFTYFNAYLEDTIITGGCPIFNSAVEADDTDPALRQQSFGMLVNLRTLVQKTLKKAQEEKQITTSLPAEQLTTVLLAQLEGGLMMSKLTREQTPLEHSIEHLRLFLFA